MFILKKFFKQLWLISVGVIAGAIIAMLIACLFYYLPMQNGAILQGELITVPIQEILLVSGLGAFLGALIVFTIGHRQLPVVVKFIALGSLYGLMVNVCVTILIANVVGGPGSLRQAPVLSVGLHYGVPLSVVIGGLLGALRYRYKRQRRV